MQRTKTIPPGATIALLGGGQLGRMFTIAAKTMGYRVHVMSPTEGPATTIADEATIASFKDRRAVEAVARQADVATLEFENVSADCAELVGRVVPLRPSARVLTTVQNRQREKAFLQRLGLPCAPFANVASRGALDQAIQQVGLPAVLKSAASGYDGLGQARIVDASAADAAWEAIGGQVSVLEAFVDYSLEFSVVVARNPQGDEAYYGPIVNRHRDHILDVSLLGQTLDPTISERACALAARVAQGLGVVGVVCIEFFLTRGGEILINEIAPRPHNSGHLTIEACLTSQFEQQVRAVCGLPLGSTETLRPAAMANLLGDLWRDGEPDWTRLLRHPGIRLHLYGKQTPRPRRKMGHLTALAEHPDDAEAMVRAARDSLHATSAAL